MIKIEVTGNSVAEVADKLLAIGASLLMGKTPDGKATTMMGALGGLKASAPSKLNAIMPELIEEVVYVPDVVVGPAPKVTEAAPEPVAPAPEPEAPALNAEALKQLVLSVVAAKGRDAMVELLGRFGAARATDVPAEQQAELVDALQDVLA